MLVVQFPTKDCVANQNNASSILDILCAIAYLYLPN